MAQSASESISYHSDGEDVLWSPAISARAPPFVAPRTTNRSFAQEDEDEEDDDEEEEEEEEREDSDVEAPTTTTIKKSTPELQMRLESSPVLTTNFSTHLRHTFGAPPKPRVNRKCVVKCTRLEMLKPLNKGVNELSLSVRIRGQKLKHMLRSKPLVIGENDNATMVDMALDLWFSLGYLHRLKGEPSMLQILLHKRKRKSRNFKKQGSIDIPLDQVLQRRVDEPIMLEQQKLNSRAMVAKLSLQITTEFNSSSSFPNGLEPLEPTAVPPPPAAAARDTEMDEDRLSQSSGGSDGYVSDTSVMGESGIHGKVKKPPNNALAKLRPTLMSKMKMVKQSGTRFFDKLRKLRRKTPSMTSDEDYSMGEELASLEQLGFDSGLGENYSNEDSELRNLPWQDMDTQLRVLSESNELFPSMVLLVDRNTRQSNQLKAWCCGAGKDALLSSSSILFFGDCSESEIALTSITSLYKQRCQSLPAGSSRPPLRICIGGDDTSIGMILRPFVQLLAREPRGWQDLRFFIVPLDNGKNPNDNRIAQKLANADPRFRGLFYSSQWQDALDGKSKLIEPVARAIEETLSHYVFAANGVCKFPIAEAMLELNDIDESEFDGNPERISFPFMRDLSIVDLDDEKDTVVESAAPVVLPVATDLAPSAASVSAAGPAPAVTPAAIDAVPLPLWMTGSKPKPIVVEYWVTKKGAVRKLSIKTGFLSLCARRLGSDVKKPPILSRSGTWTASRNKGLISSISNQAASGTSSTSSTTPATTAAATATVAAGDLASSGPLEAEPDVMQRNHLHMTVRLLPKDKNKFLVRLGAYSPKKASGSGGIDLPMQFDADVTKIVCFAKQSYSFCVAIDGIVVPNVKFLSLSPLWPARVKAFPIASFR